MKMPLSMGFLLSPLIVFPSASMGQSPSIRGLFLASTGPRSEYAKSFWWELSETEIVFAGLESVS